MISILKLSGIRGGLLGGQASFRAGEGVVRFGKMPAQYLRVSAGRPRWPTNGSLCPLDAYIKARLLDDVQSPFSMRVSIGSDPRRADKLCMC